MPIEARVAVQQKVDAAVRRLGRPDLVVIAGSGFQAWAVSLGGETESWSAGERQPVAGHRGRLRSVRRAGGTLWIFEGRRHLYEGVSTAELVAPVEWAACAGAGALLLTCATGGLRDTHRPGDLGLVNDHVNWTGVDILSRVPIEQRDPAFLDLHGLYDAEFRQSWHSVARLLDGKLDEGVLVAVHGPCYETPAEVRTMRKLGFAYTGMSVVHEAVWARYCGLRTAALTVIANPAAGMGSGRIDHESVLDVVTEAMARRSDLLSEGLDAMLAALPARSRDRV